MIQSFSLRANGDPETALRAAEDFFRATQATPVESGPHRLRMRRGSPLRRWTSSRLEQWPMDIEVSAQPLTDGGAALTLAYHLHRTRRLFGASDLLVLEAEAALLDGALQNKGPRSLEELLSPLRSQVAYAIRMNVVLAVMIVVWAGRMAGFAWPWVILAALGVAALDAIVIAAFADLIVESVRRVPPSPQRGVTASTGDQR